MSKHFKSRITKAHKLARDLKAAAEWKGSELIIMFDGELIKPSQIVIHEDGFVAVHVGKCIHGVFNIDLDMTGDGGIHQSAESFEKEFRSRFQLLKPISW